VYVLEAIYEEDFLGLSCGYRPGRGQHDARDALHAGIYRKQVNWVLDADIQGFFDAMAHSWTIRFLEHRIAANEANGKDPRRQRAVIPILSKADSLGIPKSPAT
jgi:retron-type reverse transcriptase